MRRVKRFANKSANKSSRVLEVTGYERRRRGADRLYVFLVETSTSGKRRTEKMQASTYLAGSGRERGGKGERHEIDER